MLYALLCGRRRGCSRRRFAAGERLLIELADGFERQTVEGQRFQQDAQAEINELQMELQNEFQKKVLPMLSQVSQERGLQLLLSRSDAGVVWADPGLDLTSDVVKKLDAVTAKPAAVAPKK